MVLLALGALSFAAAALAGNEPVEVKGRVTGVAVVVDSATGKYISGLVPDVYVKAADPSEHRYNWRERSQSAATKILGNLSRELFIAAYGPGGTPPTAGYQLWVAGGRVTGRVGGHPTPSTIVVMPKTKLAIENHDPFRHNLKIGANTVAIAPGDKYEMVAPDGAQKIEITDELFPTVHGYVIVDPQVYDCAAACPVIWAGAHDEHFSRKLPPGEYTLRAYFGGKQVGKDAPVKVTTKDQAVDLNPNPWDLGGSTP